MTYPMHWDVEMQISWLKPESENLYLPLDFGLRTTFLQGTGQLLFWVAAHEESAGEEQNQSFSQISYHTHSR